MSTHIQILTALAQLAYDEEFARSLHDAPDRPGTTSGGTRVSKYLQARGVEEKLSMILSIAYSAGMQHALDWAGRAIDRADKAARGGGP